MKSALFATQEAIYSALSGDSTLMALVTGVYDEVPETVAFPYIVIGDATTAWWGAHGTDGEVVTVTLHVWSQYMGFKQADAILNEMNRLLAQKVLTVTGYVVEFSRLDYAETLRDPDGQTRHVIVRYRIRLLEN